MFFSFLLSFLYFILLLVFFAYVFFFFSCFFFFVIAFCFLLFCFPIVVVILVFFIIFVLHALHFLANRTSKSNKRILFAENVSSYEEHVSRYCVADLFLDTFNYNGHSTLVECIWSELPFVTFLGESFASRVGGSILHSLGLDELICESHDEYVD